ncbi:MAG: serine/threonine protein kinase [Verrucomicrobiales bacterium]
MRAQNKQVALNVKQASEHGSYHQGNLLHDIDRCARMLIKFVCGNCNARLKIEYTYAGEKIECPECAMGIRVPSNEIAPGVVIGGFEIKELIGKGGMGEVYLAQQLSMGRDIALKILPAGLTRDKSLVNRFLQEVRNSAQLNHPNIVTAYEAGEDDGIYYMAMAFVKGDTLDHLLQTNGFMQEAEALKLIRTVAVALQSAWNDQQMIHRDIKPENIMIDHKGTPMVLDMGLSKSIHDQASLSTSPDTIMGSPNFMSPEQTQDSVNVDFRTDMYSLGTTLYNVLTGQVPFHGNSYIETLKKQATGQLKDPRNHNPDIGENCLLFMERLLAKAPEDRFDSWDELISALDQVIQDGSFQATGIPAGESMLNTSGKGDAQPSEHSSGMKKPPTVITTKSTSMGMMLLLALLAGGVIAFVFTSNQKKPPEPQPATGHVTPGIQNPPQLDRIRSPKPNKVAHAYSEAVLYWQSNPAAYAEALSKFEAVGNQAPNSEWALKAVNCIEEVKAAREEQVDVLVESLKTKGQRLVAEGKVDEAIALLESYDGPLASETLNERTQAIAALGNHQRRMENEQQRMLQEAEQLAVQTSQAIADHLLNEDSAAATALLAKMKSALTDEQFNSLMQPVDQLINQYTHLAETIMNSYTADLNNELKVELKRGVENLQIKKIDQDGTVSAIRKIRNGDLVVGHSVVEFSCEDLSTREMISRLDQANAPDRDILKGLIFYQAGSISAARTLFNSTPTAAGKLLKHRLDVRLGLAKDPPRLKKLDGPNPPDVLRRLKDRLEDHPRGPGPRPVPPVHANPSK